MRACRRPSDFGFDDDGFVLPPLVEREVLIEDATPRDGMLFSLPARDLREQRAERRATIIERCTSAADIANQCPDGSVLWCHLNQEADMLVDMVTETEAARLLAYRGLDLVDKGERCRWQASMAKAFATEMGVRVTSKAIQIHGAVGVVTDYPIERYFRDARMNTIPDGTTQIQKLIAGRELTGIRALT